MKDLASIIKRNSGIEWTPDTTYDWKTASWIVDRLWDRESIDTEIIWHPDGYKVALRNNSNEFNHINR